MVNFVIVNENTEMFSISMIIGFFFTLPNKLLCTAVCPAKKKLFFCYYYYCIIYNVLGMHLWWSKEIESQSLSYNQDTELTILFYINKARAMILSTLVQYTLKSTFTSWFFIFWLVLNINIQFLACVTFILGIKPGN